MEKLERITPKEARYIKLGEKGGWEKLSLQDGTLRIGYYEVSHELGLKNDREAVRAFYIQKRNCTPATATQHANQICDFYAAGKDDLWITFSSGHLWWCFACPEVEYFGSDHLKYPNGSRLRRTIKGWRNTSLAGLPLRINELNGNLTKTSAFRQTICAIKGTAFNYLVRKINDEPMPEVEEAKNARVSILEAIQNLMMRLPWKDFELLVDLIFSQSGWRRISVVGEDLKTVDMELILPTTGERAMIQVKSSATQAQFDEYVQKFLQLDIDRMFYVYHTAETILKNNDRRIILIAPEKLAEMVLEAGLLDWLIKKVG